MYANVLVKLIGCRPGIIKVKFLFISSFLKTLSTLERSSYEDSTVLFQLTLNTILKYSPLCINKLKY